MTKWIEEENGEVWIPTSTAAKMLGIEMQGVNHMLQRGILVHVRKPARNRTNYYLLSEVEALARNTKRVVKLVTHETRQESRIPGDLAKVDKTFLSGKEAMKFLTINNTALSWYVNHGDLTSYQSVPGRSPHRFDPYEVRILKHKRERLKRIRETNLQFRTNEARISGKPVPRPPRTDALHASDLLPFEHHMGTWITVRQTASLLGVSVYTVYQIKDRGRLYGEKRQYESGLRKQKQWLFRKTDVLTLLNDPDYRKGREHYQEHCAPLSRHRKAEHSLTMHTPVSSLDWEDLGSQWRVIEGGEW